jgi:hypothetical protein
MMSHHTALLFKSGTIVVFLAPFSPVGSTLTTMELFILQDSTSALQYMKHIADASYSSHQPAFQIAFQDRNRTREDDQNGPGHHILQTGPEEQRMTLSWHEYQNGRGITSSTF